MKAQEAAGPLTRRDFLRRLPGHLMEKLGTVAREGMSAFSSNAGRMTLSRDLVAQIEVSRCHAWSGFLCQHCYLACPKRERAIEMRDQKPVINALGCDGCAMCLTACETVNDLPAVRMVPRAPASPDPAPEKEATS